ncbi:response regulator [Aggregicoccus sp. 17bor-14]|uniref:ATP-binding protein n=1 Tax=Myxococcaceae TaxID=31 RepID=UPI00129C3221|nr:MULTISPECIES: ATP-binding protein [Myxococcaceae]MBF5045518.1 response regulator [Simulacricoccus sp. 17bor-14]MRI91255.1 response regulator [Aggregicoccus sp. 17bor-14]
MDAKAQLLAQLPLRTEQDVVQCRRLARELAAQLGFSGLEQTRIATAVSEIARNAFVYAGGGEAELRYAEGPPLALWVRVSDRGPGIPALEEILEGRYDSKTGLGLGIAGSRRLMDRFSVRSGPEGTVVEMGQMLPAGRTPPQPGQLHALRRRAPPQGPVAVLDELGAQNAALVETIGALEERQAELDRLNRELAETNRGVVALYSELDVQAEALKRASQLKSQFLSHVSHEFRTPLHSVLSLSRLLQDEVDGPLTPEQARQVKFIRRSAEALSELIDDLLDLAKIEAGKAEVRPRAFGVPELLATLRGMLRPLRSDDAVQLVIDEAPGLPLLYTDEGKLAQILRNLVSNALKFTERGEVRVSARRGSGGRVVFSVRDTGVGIAPEDQERIFEEYTQIAGPHQRSRGTGLGLPLSRRLAELLGGSLSVHSVPGQGSTFTASVMGLAPGRTDAPPELELAWRLEPGLQPVLLLLGEPPGPGEALSPEPPALREAGLQLLPVAGEERARVALGRLRPAALVVDLAQGPEALEGALALLPEAEAAQVPCFGLGEGAHPGLRVLPREALADGTLLGLLRPPPPTAAGEASAHGELLIIDDDEVFRYLLRRTLDETPYRVLEAPGGPEGLALARSHLPRLIFLDLVMPGMGAPEVLEALRADPLTRDVPVIVQSAKRLAPGELTSLLARAQGFLPKQHLARETVLHQLEGVLGPLPRAR